MLLIINLVGVGLMARLIFNFPSRQRPVGKASHFSLALLCIAGNGELRVNELPCVTYHFYPTRFRGPVNPGDIQGVPESVCESLLIYGLSFINLESILC